MSLIKLPLPSRHQVAILGRVIDGETLETVRGANVEITVMPAAFQAQLAARALRFGAAWSTLPSRPDRTTTQEDGTFGFLDLPNGSYTVTTSMKGAAHRYGSTQRLYLVSRDGDGTIVTQGIPAGSPIDTVALPPTGAKGTIFSQTPPAPPTPLFLARLRVRGSGEIAHTDATGAYCLAGVELGARVVVVSAPGHLAGTTTITFTEGVVSPGNDLILTPTT